MKNSTEHDRETLIKTQKSLMSVVVMFNLKEAFLYAWSRNKVSMFEASWLEKGHDFVRINARSNDHLVGGKFRSLTFIAYGHAIEVSASLVGSTGEIILDSCSEKTFRSWERSLDSKFDEWFGFKDLSSEIR